jgi:AcrR family transcriptional regulator
MSAVGIVPRWRRRPGSRQGELLDAAEALFVDRGIAATTVSDITEAAGVAKGSFYRYFDSKEHVIAALKERFADELILRVGRAAAAFDGDDVGAVVDAVVAESIAFLLSERGIVEVWRREPDGDGVDTWARSAEKLTAVYQAGIAEGVAAGVLDCDDPRSTALLVMFAIEGAVGHAIRYGSPGQPELTAAAQVMVRRVIGLSSGRDDRRATR